MNCCTSRGPTTVIITLPFLIALLSIVTGFFQAKQCDFVYNIFNTDIGLAGYSMIFGEFNITIYFFQTLIYITYVQKPTIFFVILSTTLDTLNITVSTIWYILGVYVYQYNDVCDSAGISYMSFSGIMLVSVFIHMLWSILFHHHKGNPQNYLPIP